MRNGIDVLYREYCPTRLREMRKVTFACRSSTKRAICRSQYLLFL